MLGFTSIGGVTAWLPLFLFVILFGLSMDYHVLILTRVREFHDAGMSTEDAVAHGIRATAGLSPARPRWLEWLPRLGRQDPTPTSPTPTPTPTQERRIPALV